MKKTLWLAVILWLGTVLLAGCNKTNTPVENPSEENVGIANPASVYCEDQWGTLVLEEGSWICMFEDGSYCEEWSYFRNECQPWEIFYNTIEEQPEIWMANPASVYCIEQGWESIIMEDEEWNQYWVCRFADWTEIDEWEYFRANNLTEWASDIYSEEDLAAAEAVILNTVNNEWNVMVESFDLSYAGDEISANNLPYCQSLNPEVVECAVFTSNFYIPEQDVEMAGAFEPNSNINGYGWYVGKTTAGEWWVLTNGFG